MNVQVATLSLIDGQQRGSPSEMGHVFVCQGIFCVLLEVSAPLQVWDHACGELVARAIDAFALSKHDENHALTTVVNALNDYLLAYNERISDEEQIWAGFNALFIRHDQLFLAQAGPSQAYIAHQGLVKHYPPQLERPSRLPIPLGYAPDIECRLAQFTLQANDIILLSASHLPSLASEQIINQVLQKDPDEVISALTNLANTNDFSALVLQYEPKANAPSPSIKSKTVTHQATLPASSVRDELRRAAGEATINPNLGAKSPFRQSSATSSEKNAMPKKMSPDKSATQSTVQASPKISRQAIAPSLLRQVIASLLALMAWLIGVVCLFLSALSDWLPARLSTVAPILDQLAYIFWSFVYRLTHLIKRTLKQVLPGDQSDLSPPRQASPPTGDGSDFIKLLSAAIPLVLLLISIGLWYLQDGTIVSASNPINHQPAQAEASQIGNLLGEAQTFIQQAANVDEIQAQELLNQANQRINQAEAFTPDESQSLQIAQLREQAQRLQIQADQITRPSSIKLLSFAPENEPLILVHGSQTLFMLEKNSSTVYRLPTNSQPVDSLNALQPLFIAHQTIDEAQLLGIPQLMTWIPSSEPLHNKLLVITEEKQLFEYNSTNGFIRLLPSEPPPTPIQSAAGYAGNLYLLDAPEKQIWKYDADARGEYPLAPAGWLNATGQEQMQNPIDIAIDGYIFLLDQSGQVTRFERGQLSEGNFALQAVTPPLSNPVAIAKVAPEESDILVADPERVLRFNKEGGFITEYRAQIGNDWGSIRDITIDEQQQTLYVLSNNGIYLLDIGTNEQPQAETR